MKVTLNLDTIVRHKKGETIEVTEEEAKRLIAINAAKIATKKK